MAGYSGTPLIKKLGIKPEHTLAVLGAPGRFQRTLGRLPAGVQLRTNLRGTAVLDVVILFAPRQADLTARFAPAARRLSANGGLWVAWPKKSSGVVTNIHETFVREHGLAGGLVDNKICAIDDTWSGLRFVIRVKDRPKT